MHPVYAHAVAHPPHLTHSSNIQNRARHENPDDWHKNDILFIRTVIITHTSHVLCVKSNFRNNAGLHGARFCAKIFFLFSTHLLFMLFLSEPFFYFLSFSFSFCYIHFFHLWLSIENETKNFIVWSNDHIRAVESEEMKAQMKNIN